MQVTSDTLFHFTTSLKNLKGILSNKFQLTYCHEEYILDYQTHDSYYPMISFCDLPLSLAKEQIEKYGSYAIGMTKEWGIEKNLNPVVYIEKNSLLAKDVQATMDNFGKTLNPLSNIIKRNKASIYKIALEAVENVRAYLPNMSVENKTSVMKKLDEAIENIKDVQTLNIEHKELTERLRETINNNSNLFRYIKNYQGKNVTNKKTYPNYRFYDEREWRYIPRLNDDRVKNYLNAAQFQEYRQSNRKKPFIEKISLPFDGSQIKYLIVKSNKDIPILIKAINNIDNLTKNANETAILTTKILTVDQLSKDF